MERQTPGASSQARGGRGGGPSAPVPFAEQMMIVAGCRCQLVTRSPTPALELYLSGRVPALRRRIGASPPHRARIWVLSARYGLVSADEPLRPYHQALTTGRATALSNQVAAELRQEFQTHGVPPEILVIAPPRALPALSCLVGIPDPPRVHALSESENDWARAEHILTTWGWP